MSEHLKRDSISKAVQSLEKQCIRLSAVLNKLLILAKSAREDGGLTPAQSETLDRLASTAEGVMTGNADTLLDMTDEDRIMLADIVQQRSWMFQDQSEHPERIPEIIRALRGNIKGA